MSVINQMLKDLDARRAPLAATPSGAIRPVDTHRHFGRRSAVALGAAVVLGGLAVYWLQRSAPSMSIDPAPPALPAEAAIVRAVPVPPLSQPRPESAVTVTLSPQPAEVSAPTAPPLRTQAAIPTQRRAVAPPAKAPVVAPVKAQPPRPAPVRKQARPRSAREQARQRYQRAIEQLRAEEASGAAQSLREAVEIEPRFIDARLALAGLLLREDQRGVAESLLLAGLRLTPADPSLATLYARLLVQRSDYTAATAVLRGAAARGAKDAAYLTLLGAVLQYQREDAQAADAYRRLLQIEPRQANAWMGLAISLDRLGDATGARDAYDRALPGLRGASAEYVEGRLRALR